FRVDEFDVRHAEEAEEDLQERRLRVIRRADVLAAACGRDVDLLALDQAFGTGFGVAEGCAGTCDPVEVSLELGRDTEVVERYANHDDVGRLQFGDQGLAACVDRGLLWWALVGRGGEGAAEVV